MQGAPRQRCRENSPNQASGKGTYRFNVRASVHDRDLASERYGGADAGDNAEENTGDNAGENAGDKDSISDVLSSIAFGALSSIASRVLSSIASGVCSSVVRGVKVLPRV
jgi:hypothetical protein